MPNIIQVRRILLQPGVGIVPTTWDPLKNGGYTLSNGYLTATQDNGSWECILGTTGKSSGDWCFQATMGPATANWLIGFGDASTNLASYLGSDTHSFGIQSDGTQRQITLSGSNTFTTNDVIACRYDMTNNTAYFYKNGVEIGHGTKTAGATWYPCFSTSFATGSAVANFNPASPPGGLAWDAA